VSAPPAPHTRSPGARLLVVQDAGSPAEEPAARTAGARRAASQVITRAALRSAGEQARPIGWLLMAAAVVELLLANLLPGWASAWPWPLAAAGGGLMLWFLQPHGLREAPVAVLLAWTTAVALLVAAPAWIVALSAAQDATAGGRVAWAWLALSAGLGAVMAQALSAQAWAAAVAGLAPLLAGAAAGPSGLVAGGLLAALSLMAAARQRRRWRRHLQTTLDHVERMRRLQAELDAARRADAEKSRFLAIASHDLRQPVHALGLFAATLHKRLHDSPEQPLARNLMRSVDALDRSFSAMLDISRLDGGAVSPRRQTFPLRDMFRRLHMQFAGQAELAGLSLRFWPGSKSVTSDPQLLERIVGNLVQNAIRYTSRGGIVVVARSTRSHLNVEVWDTGCGIAPESLPRIFEEFYQVGRGERDRSKGLGIGLAIVKRLVMLLGHRLEVASTLGRGTMFRVGVPLHDLAAVMEDTAAAETQPMAASTEAACMVLVVDDEEPIREGLRQLLQEWGYQVMAAADAAQAERATVALEGRVDLVLSDLHLGSGSGGKELVASVRRLCGREVPAILVTGDTAGQALREVVDGADPVLFKPVQPRHLLEAIRRALEQPSRPGAA
jgi:two-component system, sensor histidine kinase